MATNLQFSSILDLVKIFPDEKSCHQYFAEQRWEGLMECPYSGCDNDKAYVFKDGIRYKCTCCKRIYTAKTGTFMEGSKLASIKWILAMYLVLHKKGISSVQLGKDLGVCQKTAWFVLHRIRTAFGNVEEDKLEGIVLADETFVGGKNKNRHRDKKVEKSQGRSFKDKTPVLGLLQQQEYELVERPHKLNPNTTVIEKIITRQSKVKCFVVPDTSAKSIKPLVLATVEKGSIFVSDEWHGYGGLANNYDHYVVDHGKKNYITEEGFTTNPVEGFWTQCKGSIHGTYIRPTRKHMNRYFNEFSFRYNNRSLTVQQQINTVILQMNCRLKYKDLVA